MSGRINDAAQIAALAAGHVMGVAFVQIDFATPMRLCTLPYSFTWNGYPWIGAGNLGSISALGENGDLQAQGISLSLAGLDSSLTSTLMAERYQGKPVQVWFCPLNPDNGQLIGTPIRVFSGRCDVPTIERGEKASITLTAEGKLIDFFRPRVSRYTDADQQLRYPGDAGLSYVNMLQNYEIHWGRS